MSDQIHTTVGVYPNGDYKVNGVKPEDLANHIHFNKYWRVGRMLIVDGKIKYHGSIDQEKWKDKIKEISKIKAEKYSKVYT